MDDQIHWFSIINSLMIVLFLSGMVAMIMMRTLHRDISKYNQLETADEAQEETGWKLVSSPCNGTVFSPTRPSLYSVEQWSYQQRAEAGNQRKYLAAYLVFYLANTRRVCQLSSAFCLNIFLRDIVEPRFDNTSLCCKGRTLFTQSRKTLLKTFCVFMKTSIHPLDFHSP